VTYFERVTAQNIYCTNTVQPVQSATELYLQYYTEAAATCLAAQQERNCQADVFWSQCGRPFKFYSHTYLEIRCFQFTLLAANAVSQFDSDREHVDVTKITEILCKLKAN